MSGDRLLTVKELAEYMQMSDRTLLKLAVEGLVPGVQLAGEWRFKRDVIDAWLADRMHGSAQLEDMALEDVPDGAGMPLGDLLEEKSIVAELDADDRASAIEALAQRAHASGWLVDKPWFVGQVVAREALSSTAMDGGVAFLHTRERNSAKIRRPFIVFGRSHAGIDMAALDGKPTHLLFLLGLKYDRLHLPMLGRLARMLKRPEVVRTLRAAPTAARMRDSLLQEDRRISQAAAAQKAVKKPARKR